MDKELEYIADQLKHSNKNYIFRTRTDTYLTEKEDGLYIMHTQGKKKEIEFRIKELRELYEGDGVFKFQSDDEIDHYLPLMESIKSAIDVFYDNNRDLKDKNVKFILEMLKQNPEARFGSELAHQIQNNLRLCLSFNTYSKKEVTGAIKRIIQSVEDHHRLEGSRGYLDFLQNRL